MVLAGTLFYEFATYEALGRLSRRLTPEEELETLHKTEIERGEHADQILQALCRGTARNSSDEGCGICDAFIIASQKSGIPEMLEKGTIFPKAKVIEWVPFEKELTGKVKQAIEAIEVHFSDRSVKTLSAIALRGLIGIASRTNFKKDILDRKDFLEALFKLGITLVRSPGRNGSSFIRAR